MNDIIEQLQDYCDCLDKYMEDEAVLEKNVNEMIHLISIMTCWAQKPCETFLKSERIEKFDIDYIKKCGCDNGIIEFELFYRHFIEKDSVKVNIVMRDGLKEEIIEIDQEDYYYSDLENILRVDISKYYEENRCSCKQLSKVIVTYDAGYEEIPFCLLQLFCDVLHVISMKNKCDCSTCQACQNDYSEDDVEIDYYDKEIDRQIERYVKTLVNNSYQEQLKLISICRAETNMLGVIIC